MPGPDALPRAGLQARQRPRRSQLPIGRGRHGVATKPDEVETTGDASEILSICGKYEHAPQTKSRDITRP